jgi:hypothetical protein
MKEFSEALNLEQVELDIANVALVVIHMRPFSVGMYTSCSRPADDPDKGTLPTTAPAGCAVGIA